MAKTKLYALDFDGVICDSAIETGITGWKVAGQIWQDMPEQTPADLIESFRQVRPVMETGFEAILIMRLLFEGVPAQTLLNDFSASIETIITQDKLSTVELKKHFGETRDHWIKDNIDEWIEMNPLFDGVANKLKQIDTEQCTIITTKQERFVSQIFDANDISFPPERIFGLDRQLSKQQVLSDLSEQHPNDDVLFVEDRLPTLHNVINDERLSHVNCLFADWGYNTDQDKTDAQKKPEITTINLTEFIDL
ncbi:MAG: HAD family hydrolase [Gammaproteobacteria bacterium]|nr:HAD family hydrolase [Gammaproteobacteria bacterium]